MDSPETEKKPASSGHHREAEEQPQSDVSSPDASGATSAKKNYPYHKGKKPGRKTKNQEEVEQRIRFTSFLCAQRMFKGDVKRVLKQRWNVNAKTAETYITRARKLLAQQAGKPVESHRQDAYNFYNSMMNHPQATLRDKLWAQSRIDSLFGLEIHTVKHQGDETKPIQHQIITVDPIALIDKVKALKAEAEAKRVQRQADVITSVAAAGRKRRDGGEGSVGGASEGGQETAGEEKTQGEEGTPAGN